ncbi:MAG: extracellular solute-binding protein [Butyrivibrio sp.]|nr:extracellular solute-binding protein [Butyrivibrio sp.]
MKIKTFTVITLVAAMVTSITGCGLFSSYSFFSGSSENISDNTNAEREIIRVSWWGSQERHNITIQALDLYSEQYNTEIRSEYTTWTDYFEDLASEAVGNNMPDLIQMSTTDIIRYAEKGLLTDLYPYIESGVINTTNVDQSALVNVIGDEHLYGYPTGVTSVSVTYVPKYFSQAGVSYPTNGWTWDEYIETAKTIYDKTGTPSDIPFLVEARWLFDSWVHSYGYSFFSEDGNSLPWAEDEELISDMIDALNDIKQGIDKGYLIKPETEVNWVNSSDNPISDGEIAMSFILSNYYSMYCQNYGKALGLCHLPVFEDAKDSGMYLSTNMYWCISSECENPEAAAKLLNFLVNDKSALEIIGTDRGVSVNSNIRDFLMKQSTTNKYDIAAINYISSLSKSISDINNADPLQSASVVNLLKANYIAFTYGEMTAEECIYDFIEQSNAILSSKDN